MIIGELDLDWAEQDPDYLARIKAFLVVRPETPAAKVPSPLRSTPDVSIPAELGLK